MEPNLEELRQLLKDECILRDSTIIQNVYDAVSVNFNRTEQVEDFVQSIIIARSKFNLSLEQYRGLLQKNRELLVNDAFFMRNNIMVDCPFALGKINLGDIKLYNLNDLTPNNLTDLLRYPKSIIVASSST